MTTNKVDKILEEMNQIKQTVEETTAKLSAYSQRYKELEMDFRDMQRASEGGPAENYIAENYNRFKGTI